MAALHDTSDHHHHFFVSFLHYLHWSQLSICYNMEKDGRIVVLLVERVSLLIWAVLQAFESSHWNMRKVLVQYL